MIVLRLPYETTSRELAAITRNLCDLKRGSAIVPVGERVYTLGV
jgi:hypothetical protein